MGPWGRFVENVSSKLAFFPPHPATYAVREHTDGTGELYIQPLIPDLPKVLQCTVRKLRTRPLPRRGGGNSEIITVFCPFKLPGGALAKVTILYSHGNAVDLGQMLPVFRELSKLLRVNVMGYDYTGYGCSTGLPSVTNTLADVMAVYESLVKDYGISSSSIIPYGQSVGSGPTVYVASQIADLAGAVLHSPILSGIRVLNPSIWWWPSWADVYPNHLLVPKIKCPLLVMHGTEDEVIHISCGKKVYELAKNKAPPLWAQGYNHQNLELCPEYLPTLNTFVASALEKLIKAQGQPASSAGSTATAGAGGQWAQGRRT